MKSAKLLSTFFWITRRTIRIAPFWYSGLLISYIFQSLMPIAQTYALAQVLGEAVRILGTDQTFFSHTLIWWMVAVLVTTLIRQAADLGSVFFWLRLRYVSDTNIYGDFLSRLAEIDMPYHEDPNFQSDIKKIEDALAWHTMNFLENSLNLLSQAIGIILISSLFISIAWWILLAILIPVLVDYEGFGLHVAANL